MDLGVIKDRVIEAVAITALLGGGAQLISNTVNIGRHDARLDTFERLNDNVEALRNELTATKLLLMEMRLSQTAEEISDKSE